MFDYVEMFYNPAGRQVRNGMLSPVAFDRQQVSRRKVSKKTRLCSIHRWYFYNKVYQGASHLARSIKWNARPVTDFFDIPRFNAEAKLTRFNLNSLVALDALLRHPTLTGAARSINLSQPAMSLALKRLRGTFGDELVRYDRGQAIYSMLAEELRPRISDILDRSWDLIHLARQFDPQSFRGTITICAAKSTLGFFHAPLIASLALASPNLSIRTVAYPPPPSIAGQIDLFILPDWLTSRQLPSRALFAEKFSWLVPLGHPALDAVDEHEYLSYRHAALPPGEEELFWPPDTPARELLARRTIDARAPQVEALHFLVMRNGFVATMPTRLAHHYAAVSTAVPVKAPPSLTDVMIVAQISAGRNAEPALRWLVEEIGRLTRSYDPPTS